MGRRDVDVTPGPTDRIRSLLGNTVVISMAQFGGIAVSLLLTPYILDTLGLERYGLWAFLGSIVAYTGLLQFGLGKGTVRFIAFHAERKEFETVRQIVSYGALTHLAVGAVLTPLVWVGGRALLPHLQISRPLVGTAETLFPFVFAYVFFAGATRPLAALMIGLERMWMMTVTTFASQFVYAASVIALLHNGAGLYGLLAATFIQTSFQAAMYLLIGRRLIGRVLGNPFAIDRAVLKQLLRFGGWFQVTAVAGLVNDRTDAIVIGAWVDVPSVGFYAIGNRIAQLVRMLPLNLLPPLLPAAAGIHAAGEEKRLATAVLHGNRLVALLTISMAGFVLATTPLIMATWLGRSYPHVSVVTAILVVAYVVNNLTGVGTTVVNAIGRPRYESEYAVLGMGLNIAATLVLAPFYGLYGILAGTVLGLVLCSAYFLWRFHRLMNLPFWDYLGTWIWRLAISATVAGLVAFYLRQSLPESVMHDRFEGLLALGALGSLYTAVIAVGLRVCGYFNVHDLALVRRALPARLRPLASLHAVEFFFGSRP